MICAIMQPTYLPWAGYFNLIAQSDKFVFLDDAQYQKNSWHNRNRILLNKAPHWITVPVRKAKLNQSIRDTVVDDNQNWRAKHVKLLANTYAKHPFSSAALELTSIIEDDSLTRLADLNIALIRGMLEKLDIQTSIYLSSEMSVSGSRTDRVINILDTLGASEYLSPPGARDYLEEDGFTDQKRIALRFQEFPAAAYPQRRQQEFISHLSLIDVVANVGWDEARAYITA